MRTDLRITDPAEEIGTITPLAPLFASNSDHIRWHKSDVDTGIANTYEPTGKPLALPAELLAAVQS